MNFPKEQVIDIRKRVMEKEFSRMNDRQKEAVFQVNGPLLILAGAGSGKTTVIVNRIANLIRFGNAYHSDFVSPDFSGEDWLDCENYLSGETESLAIDTAAHLADWPCEPWRVLAITFTNKAAGEMKERLTKLLGSGGQDIWASTFHSTCARILRREGDRLGFTNHFTIYDTDDSRRLMKQCLKELDIPEKILPPRSALAEISRAKDTLLTPQEFLETAAGDYRLTLIGRAYERYQDRLIRADAMDFDDLIANTVRLFRECPDVLEHYQNRFRYIMVDEYQDTNHAQYLFVSMLAEKYGNICVVGDDDQSIYKFRGATIENIMSFEKTFPGAKVIRLEQNYRSTQTILDAANAVIGHNTQRKGKTLWTANGAGAKIVCRRAANEQDEADFIARKIMDGVASGRKFSDFAILYRMNSQSNALERFFVKSAIPYRIIGGTRFYERAEVKDIISYLCVISNPSDTVRLARIINRPKRAIGDRTVELLSQIAADVGISVFEVMKRADEFAPLSRAAGRLKEFAALIENLRNKLADNTVLLSELYTDLIEKIRYEEFLKTEYDDAEDRIDNIQELRSNIRKYEEENEEAALSGFLEDVALMTDIDNFDPDADSIVMMTMHSAKGLEFPVVFLPGMEENIFPGAQTAYDPSEVEEERRLAYVAITRAKEELYLIHAESRMIFGSTQRNRASRFVEEIPSEKLEISDPRPVFSAMRSSAEKKAVHLPALHGAGFPVQKNEQTYRVGDRVAHRIFGEGLVVGSTPMGNDCLLEIAFDTVGTKKLMSNFSKLKKL